MSDTLCSACDASQLSGCRTPMILEVQCVMHVRLFILEKQDLILSFGKCSLFRCLPNPQMQGKNKLVCTQEKKTALFCDAEY